MRAILSLCALINAASFLAAPARAAEICDVRDFGARGDGIKKDTAAIQAAIDACAARGGGQVKLQDGVFLSGTLRLKSRIELRIEEGATLKGTQDDADYPDLRPVSDNRELKDLRKALIYAEKTEDISITGPGTIDGNGGKPSWHGWVTPSTRPVGIFVAQSKRVLIEGFRFRDGAMWGVVAFESDDVTIRKLDIQTLIFGNRDGIDIVDSHRVLIEDNVIAAEDDAICLKSGNARKVKDVTVRRNRILKSVIASGLKLGTASVGGFENILFEDIEISDVDKSAMAVESVDGGTITNVTFRRIRFTRAGSGVFIVLGKRAAESRVGAISSVTFEDVSGDQMRDPSHGTIVTGTDFGGGNIARLKDIVFRDFHLTAPGGYQGPIPVLREQTSGYPEVSNLGQSPAAGAYFRHVDGLVFESSSVTLDKSDVRAPLVRDDVLNDRAEDFPDRGSACFGMSCCPAGQAIKRIDRKPPYLVCEALPAEEKSDPEDCFVDHATWIGDQKTGMHACPSGTYLRGFHADRDLLTCCYNQKRGFTGFASQSVVKADGCASDQEWVAGVSRDAKSTLCRRYQFVPAGDGPALPGLKPESSRSYLSWKDRVSHADWQRVARNWLLRILAVEPGATGTNPPAPQFQVLGSETLASGVVRQDIRYLARADGDPVRAFLLFPPGYDAKLAASYPAALFTHGHSDAAKWGSAGADVDVHHAGGLHLAETGFVVLAPDTRGFGSRNHEPDGVHESNLDAILGNTGHHGRNAQLLVQDNFDAVSLLLAVPGVDSRRVYSTGLSLGGWQSMWIGALDTRLAGTVASGIYFGMRCLNDAKLSHPCQNIPSLSASLASSQYALLFGTEDLGALIGPRPFLTTWGERDPFYSREPYKACTREADAKTREIFQAIGASDRYQSSARPEMGHEWDAAAADLFLLGL